MFVRVTLEFIEPDKSVVISYSTDSHKVITTGQLYPRHMQVASMIIRYIKKAFNNKAAKGA